MNRRDAESLDPSSPPRPCASAGNPPVFKALPGEGPISFLAHNTRRTPGDRWFGGNSEKRAYKKLPKEVQEQVDRKLDLLAKDPKHPSLRIKRVKKIWSVRISALI